MKTLLSVLFGLVLLSYSANAQPLTVHEWGTFTTLHGSNGGTLSGLYFEEEQLPSFVYHFPGFSPDPAIATNGYIPCKDVTVKMETPVLYFYSPVERAVQVHVDFPMGAISQWYPNRSGGEVFPSEGRLDFDNGGRNGSIDWKATVLDPNTTEKLTQTTNISTKWERPRETNSNLIKNQDGEIEKYLFYRGLANFPLPVEVIFTGNGALSITNTSKYDIPYIYIYDHAYDSASVWGTGPLSSGEKKIFVKPSKYYGEDASIPEYNDFYPALTAAGLTREEGLALLGTWNAGYFQTEGFKIFWIVPRKLTDQILPLQISPNPDVLERVLVGKTEILTPFFEQVLVDYYKANKNLDPWKDDRYHLAYMQRVQQLLATEAVSVLNASDEMSITPNPATTTMQIRGASGSASITIRNILGESLLNLNQDKNSELDIHNLPSGVYFVSIADGALHRTLKLVKK